MAGVAKLASVSTLDATAFVRGVGKMLVSMKPLEAAAAGAFGGVGFVVGRFVTQMVTGLPRAALAGLQLGDSLADSARMTGISASKLAVYYRAARLAGVGADEFNTIVHRLNVNVAEAIKGDAKFADILKRSGVNLANLADLSPDQTFLTLADAISKTKSAYERAYVAQQAFGRSGHRLLPLLSGGSAGISSMAASTRALGAAPSSVDVLRLEKANDALQDLTTVWQGFKLELGKQIAPDLTKAINDLTKWLGDNKIVQAAATAAAAPVSAARTTRMLSAINPISSGWIGRMFGMDPSARSLGLDELKARIGGAAEHEANARRARMISDAEAGGIPYRSYADAAKALDPSDPGYARKLADFRRKAQEERQRAVNPMYGPSNESVAGHQERLSAMEREFAALVDLQYATTVKEEQLRLERRVVELLEKIEKQGQNNKRRGFSD